MKDNQSATICDYSGDQKMSVFTIPCFQVVKNCISCKVQQCWLWF